MTAWSEKDEMCAGINDNAPEHKNKKAIACQRKRTSVENFILVRVVLC
jgi:hypothetical protein